MPIRPDDPLRRVTLNLYEADCRFLEKYFGHGWTSEIRESTHAYTQKLKMLIPPTPERRTRTLGDFADD